jgi:hypothetical protein
VFTQSVATCTTHRSCAVIACTAVDAVPDPDGGGPLYPAGTVVWESHLDDAVHVEHRVNPDYPAHDLRRGGVPVRYQPPCRACRDRPPFGG